ncbi:MAG: flagellar basal body rod C-terminal domain-containing protein [Thermodesulfobacteriota bacterium]
MDISAPASALSAFALSQQVAAHNLANVNTEELRASRATLEDRPDQGGVAVQEVRQTSAEPPQVPSVRLEERQGRVEQAAAYAPGSTTDAAREMVNLAANQRAYEANAAVIRARDEMVGAVLDIRA